MDPNIHASIAPMVSQTDSAGVTAQTTAVSVEKSKSLGRDVKLEKQRKPKTHNINQVAIILNRHRVDSPLDLKKKRIKILKDYLIQLSPEERQNVTPGKVLDLMKAAYMSYAKVEDYKTDSQGRQESSHKLAGDLATASKATHIPSAQTLLSRKKELREIGQDLLQAKEEVGDRKLQSVKSKGETEIERFEGNYDTLEAAEIKMEKMSQTLKERVAKKSVVHVKNIVIGAGDAATEYWLDMHKGSHQQTSQGLAKDKEAVSDVLMLASNTGNWKHDYTLAQTYSLLERGAVPSNPQDFTTTDKYDQNRHVNARFLYQSNLINLSDTEAPVMLGSQVLSVEKRDQHQSDWEVKGASNRVNIQLKLSEKTLKRPILINQAAIQLFEKLTGKPAANNYAARDFLAKLLNYAQLGNVSTDEVEKGFSTDAVLKLLEKSKNPESFEQIKKELNLPKDLSYSQFAKHLQLCLDQVVSASLESAKQTLSSSRPGNNKEYQSFRVALDPYEKPTIVNGQIALINDTFINKQVYADQINVCAGFGEARRLTDKQLDPSINHLTKFNHALGYTPVVDGNSFMLTAKEESASKKDIIIYGGGGNATACFRKAFFRHDTHLEDREYKKENQFASNLTWFSRDGFELAGYGKLAKTAISFAKDNDQLCCGDLVKVEETPSGKVKLYFRDLAGTYEKQPVKYSQTMNQNHPTKEISNPANPSEKIMVREFECDQFVYTIGQDDKPVTNLFKEYEKDYEVFKDDSSLMPLGVKTQDNSIRFWGATALVVSPSSKVTANIRQADIDNMTTNYQTDKQKALETTQQAVTDGEKAQAAYQTTKAEMRKFRIEEAEARKFITEDKISKGLTSWASEFNDRLRDWIVIQRIARDAEWPGVMPPSRVSSRQAALIQTNEFVKELQKTEAQLLSQKNEMDQKIQTMERKIASLSNEDETLTDAKKTLLTAQNERDSVIEKIQQAKVQIEKAQSEFSHANANLDDIEYINGLLVKAGVDDTNTRVKFLTALLEARQAAYENNNFPGIDRKTAKELLEKFGIDDHVVIEGHCTFAIKK